MVMVTLFCAVVGEGAIVPVDIDDQQSVGHLKEAIANKTKYCSEKPHLLTLYMAKQYGKTGGELVQGDDEEKEEEEDWMKYNNADLVQLQMATIPEDIVKKHLNSDRLLNPTGSIEDYFAGAPKKNVIHVLVQLPKDGVGVPSGARDDSRLARIEEKIDYMYGKSATVCYKHSEISSKRGRELLERLHIRVVPVETVPFPIGSSYSIAPFEWKSVRNELGQEIKLTEEQQSKPYLRYVESNIGDVLSQKKLCVFGVEKGQDVLTVQVPGHDIKLSGRTDLLILGDSVKDDPDDLQFLSRVKMLIEVKREVKLNANSQALSELIALDLIVNEPVLALLTDLNKTWRFFWVSERRDNLAIIHKALVKDPGDAFQVIRTLLQQPTDETQIELPCFPQPLKRRKLAHLLPSVSESGDDCDIRGAIERYYDIASVLGPDIQMARAVANQITRAIPGFSSPNLSYFS